MPFADPKRRVEWYLAYYQANKKKILTEGGILRSQEMVIVAQMWGDDVPRCRADLTPGLLDAPCAGALQIDHINGGGGREQKGTGRTWKVVHGKRRVDDLRILCELHHWYHTILRNDNVGGSTTEEWEE